MEKKKSEFEKVFSAWDILVIAFGAMIGWGWVVSTGDWIQRGGVIGAMLGFILGGIMIFFIGLTYAELTPAMPECGGVHIFSLRALGPTGSFVCTWAIILGYVSVVCFEACALPTIITYLYPGFLKGYLYTIAGFDVYASWLAVAVILAIIITLINVQGAKTAAVLQTILTCIIGGAGILLIVASVVRGDPGNIAGQAFVGSSGNSIVVNILRVAMMSPFFFLGFDVIPQAAEEINVPLKKIAKMLLLSIILAVSFYALIILSVGLVMNSGEIAASAAGSGMVTADAMAKAFNTSVMAKVLILGGLCGIITSWNSFLIGGSRALYSMAVSYMIPPFFGKLNEKYKTPVNALLVIGLLSCLAPFLGRKMLLWICDAGNLACCLAYCMVAISFVVLRKKEPTMPRPYKVKHYKIVGALAIAMSGFMVLMYIIPGSGATLAPIEWGIVGGWSAIGVAFYFFCKSKYGEKFASMVEVANEELDQDYAKEREAAAEIAAEESAEPAPVQKPAAAAVPSAATLKDAEVAVALDRISSKVKAISHPEMNFSYFLPVNIVFGAGKIKQAGTLAKQYGRKALIVTGRSSAKKSGVYDKVNDSLEQAGLQTVLFDRVSQNPLTTTAVEGAEMAKMEGCDVIVAIGGGSIMDAAKGIAFMAINDGDINDYLYNRKQSDEALPLILIPTTCGTGSEGNGFAVLTNPDTGDKKSLRCPAIVAKASIVDPECMMTMPKKILASVGFDALCHCIEAYTANNAQPFTDALALYAIPLILENLPNLYHGKESMDAWSRMSIASTIGGMVINTAGVTLAHAMEHPVSGLKNVVHGMGLAAITPVAVEATWMGNRYKFGKLARMMGGYTAEDCAEKIRSFLRSIDLEVGLADLGVEEKDIPWLAKNVFKVSPANIKNTPVKLTEEDIAALYRKAMYVTQKEEKAS
ncbi:MAG: iron-containing alcohol dehydrogenase [Lachnospiraceae bacterium]|jgi:alcohol dehydrogenase class IV/amino acid transporter|nr:iron-containing alcohol dehydrogenase [Lachnospiraceae bacterium]MCI1328306.1 iron-containing alcohol dehydrogenase [Lachnospiraceae bacterium]